MTLPKAIDPKRIQISSIKLERAVGGIRAEVVIAFSSFHPLAVSGASFLFELPADDDSDLARMVAKLSDKFAVLIAQHLNDAFFGDA